MAATIPIPIKHKLHVLLIGLTIASSGAILLALRSLTGAELTLGLGFAVLGIAALSSLIIGFALHVLLFGPLRRLHQEIDRSDLQKNRRLRLEVIPGDGDVAHLTQAVSKSMSDLQHANFALEVSRKQYQRLVDGLTDSVLVVQDGEIVFANKMAAERLAGGDRDRLTGMAPEELLDKSSRKLWRKALESTSETTILNSSIRMQLRSIDGDEPSTVMLKAAPVHYDGNSAVQIMLSDISLLLEEEEAQMQRDRLESIGELAGGIAHDFNNLLTVMLGSFSLVTMSEDIPEDLRGLVVRGEDACEKARKLADQLLVFAKDQPHMRRLLMVGDVLRDAMASALAGGSIRADLDMQEDPGAIEGDQDRLNQVFHNVLMNARQAMPSGGVIKVEVSQLVVTELEQVADLPVGTYAQITIADQGVGVPEGFLAKVFDPYASTKPNCTGLGLSVAYAIVKRHGGEIKLDSIEGEGTTVTICLPISTKPLVSEDTPLPPLPVDPLPPEAPAQTKCDAKPPVLAEDPRPVAEERSSARARLTGTKTFKPPPTKRPNSDRAALTYLKDVARPGRGERILIMDDDEPVRRMIGNLLERSGYTPILVERGEAAIEQYKKAMDADDPFRLVILDLTIVDGMGGQDTIMHLKKMDPSIVAMVCSGYSNDPVMANPTAFGFKAMVRKPYRVNELISNVERLIGE